MKKLWILIGMLTCLFAGSIPVSAAETDYTGIYVWDTAEIMSTEEQNALQARAAEIAEAHHCGCYIVTVGDYRDYSSDSPYEAAKSIYRDMEFGYGSGKDGEMLMLSMDDRDFAIIAYGDYGNTVFTDYGKEKLDEVYLDNFRNNDWYGGFSDYLTQSEMYLEYAEQGTPFDVDSDPEAQKEKNMFRRIAALIVGLIAGGAVCGGMYAGMATAVEAGDADVYAVRGSMKLTRSRDVFQHRSVSHRHIQRSSGGGGGGGGTHVDSGGFSGHSGKF